MKGHLQGLAIVCKDGKRVCEIEPGLRSVEELHRLELLRFEISRALGWSRGLSGSRSI